MDLCPWVGSLDLDVEHAQELVSFHALEEKLGDEDGDSQGEEVLQDAQHFVEGAQEVGVQEGREHARRDLHQAQEAAGLRASRELLGVVVHVLYYYHASPDLWCHSQLESDGGTKACKVNIKSLCWTHLKILRHIIDLSEHPTKHTVLDNKNHDQKVKIRCLHILRDGHIFFIVFVKRKNCQRIKVLIKSDRLLLFLLFQ